MSPPCAHPYNDHMEDKREKSPAAEVSSDEEVMGEEEAKARRNGMEWVGDAGGLQ